MRFHSSCKTTGCSISIKFPLPKTGGPVVEVAADNFLGHVVRREEDEMATLRQPGLTQPHLTCTQRPPDNGLLQDVVVIRIPLLCTNDLFLSTLIVDY